MADCEPNAHRFMDLTVPEYAYMFGFLQADGHLSRQSRNRGGLTVEVSARDIDLLRQFQKLTPYSSSITERTRSTNFAPTHTAAIWSLHSLEARTRINELGLPYGRKSRVITPPTVEFSRRDYLRGLFDADGSVGFTGKGLPFIALTTASSAIASFLRDYAKDVTGAERTLRRNTRDAVYNVLYTMETAQRLAADLYYSDCLSLERKRAAADALATWARPAGSKPRPPRIEWTSDMDRVLLAAPTIAHAAAELGCSQSACQVRRWKLLNGVIPQPL